MSLRVHFHTDNHAFSGSEVVLTSLFRWAESDLDVIPSVTYRSSAGYDGYLQAQLPAGLHSVALRLPDPTDLAARWKERPLVWSVVRGLAEAAALTKLFFAFDVLRLQRCFRNMRPDVLHVNNGGFPGATSCNAAVVAARLAGVPVVTYVVNNLAIPRRGVRRWSDWPVDRMTARWVTQFVTGSSAAAAALRAVLKLRADQVRVIPNGVDAATTRRREPMPLPTLPQGSVVLLVVARLEQRKGHRILFEAVSRILREETGPRPVVLVAGDGPERAVLEQEVGRLGASEAIHMLGHRDDIPELLQRCDIVVLPSIGQEDFPLVVLEAMAAGRPVVATEVAGIPEQVVHKGTGLLVPAGSVDELAVALRDLINNLDLRFAYGKAGLERFKTRFSADLSVQRYEQMFSQLVEASTPCR